MPVDLRALDHAQRSLGGDVTAIEVTVAEDSTWRSTWRSRG